MDAEAVLETDRLRLEPLRALHAALLFTLLSDARLYEFVPQDPPATEAMLEARYRWLEKRVSPDGREGWLNWAVVAKEDGACLGTSQATLREDGTALIAYELGSAHWGKGYATEACSRVLAFLFETCAIRSVLARVDTRNGASIRLLERLGFERIGFHPGADTFKGSVSDEYEYGLQAPARIAR